MLLLLSQFSEDGLSATVVNGINVHRELRRVVVENLTTDD